MNKNKGNKQEKFITLGIIIIFIIILSFRITNQGNKMNELLEETDEAKIEIDLEDPANQDSEEEKELDKTFTSPKGDLTLNYPSNWTETEDEDVLNLFNAPEIPEKKYGEEEMDEIDYEDNYSDLKNTEGFDKKMEVGSDQVGETIFIATRVMLPTFSFGIISIQDLKIEEINSSELEELLTKELKHEDENMKTEIEESSIEENFISIKTITSIDGRPVFKSRNLGLIGKNSSYLINFASAYETWDEFESEFNSIMSSLEFEDEN